jgi:tRNA(Ile)-lysidine synthase
VRHPAAITDPADAAGAAILDRIADILDRRLDRDSRAPLAVGFSGGGDSLALLLAARAWAARAGRPLLALTVDHGLNPSSAAWTHQAASVARRLGVRFQAMKWEGDKPASGLSAAARRARHTLLAEAAREAGASVLLFGHTLDDVREAAWMRGRGSSVGDPREWAPSPVWPEGRGVFLLRPLIGIGRMELRSLIGLSGLPWIEDPANADDRFLRSRARRAGLAAAVFASEAPGPAGDFEVDAAGAVRLDRRAALDGRLLAMACVVAGGGSRLPRSDEIERLRSRIGTGEQFAATLAGARLEAGESVTICRDPGGVRTEHRRLDPGQVTVWDGRFEIGSDRPGAAVRPLGGMMSALDKRSHERLRVFAPSARRALPALVQADGTVTCPILAQDAFGWARTLVSGRLEAACGRIAREPAPWTGSHGERDAGALS